MLALNTSEKEISKPFKESSLFFQNSYHKTSIKHLGAYLILDLPEQMHIQSVGSI